MKHQARAGQSTSDARTPFTRMPISRELLEPIYAPLPNQLNALAAIAAPSALNALASSSASPSDQRDAQIRAFQSDKFKLLVWQYVQHCGLNPGESNKEFWQDLAYWIAADFFPGMRVQEGLPPRKRGRPSWSFLPENYDLAVDIEELALRKGITQSQACTRLVKLKNSKWKGEKHRGTLTPDEARREARALYARYQRHIKRNRPDETAPSRMKQLLEQLWQSREARAQSSGDSDGSGDQAKQQYPFWLEEPVRRILANSDGTKIQ